ncbi:MAG: recombinase family protein [Clostridiales bacterium]|nr:recombinase family protein [Clostridiales bacterium]
MIYGYCRVSTRKQLTDGNSLQAQAEEIKVRYENAEVIEEQYTGTSTDRPIFTELVQKLNAGDTLVVTKLDRLARNTVEGIQVVEKLFAKGVAVHVLNVGLLENTTMGKFFLTTLLAVAEMERNTIIERTQAGKEVAKTKAGFKDGRPRKYTQTQLDIALDLIENKKKSYTQVEQEMKISKSTLVRAMRMRKASKDINVMVGMA